MERTVEHDDLPAAGPPEFVGVFLHQQLIAVVGGEVPDIDRVLAAVGTADFAAMGTRVAGEFIPHRVGRRTRSVDRDADLEGIAA